MNFLLKKITRNSLDPLIEKYKTNEKVLDLGSAKSPYSKWYPNRISVDISKESGADIIADAHNLPLPDNSENFILCTEMLEHMYDPKQAVTEMYRVLKPGGTVVLTTRFMYGIHDAPHDYFRFTKFGLKELFKNFEILELKEETTNFETIGALLQRLVFQSRFVGGSVGDKFFKILILLVAKFFTKLNSIISEQYGDIRKTHLQENIFASGYLIVCRKK